MPCSSLEDGEAEKAGTGRMKEQRGDTFALRGDIMCSSDCVSYWARAQGGAMRGQESRRAPTRNVRSVRRYHESAINLGPEPVRHVTSAVECSC